MATPSSSRKRPHPKDFEEADNVKEMEWSDDEGTTVDGIYIPPPAKPITLLNSSSRLIITKITNNFFKSYAEHQVLGPFHKCFNAIVGPNGSGKSNVIDSMLFVFGYRATKIRSKKVSVLLHNSAQYNKVKSCTVAVHFCEIIDKPEGGYDVIPGSEFVVSRTANIDNSSFYELNGSRVQFKEIALLLRKHGIDLDHNRFLILQGEVEEIAMMKCKAASENETGMLEYLEDIIGTHRYKKPLKELSERIDILTEQRTEKVNRLKIVQKELEQLRGPMEEAVGFLKAENTVVVCKNVLYQKSIYELETKIKTLEEEHAQVKEQHDRLVGQLDALTAEKSEKEKTLKREAAVYENLQQRKDTLKEAFDNADKKEFQLQADMTQTNSNRKKFKEQLAAERKKLAELERLPEQHEKTIVECEAKEVQLAAKKEKLDEEKKTVLANIRSETQHLQDEKEQLSAELAKLKEVVDATKSDFAVSESELKIYLGKSESEVKKLEHLRETYTKSEESIQQNTEELSQLKKILPTSEKALRAALTELATIREEEGRYMGEITQKRASLEQTRSTMQASRSRGKVLDSLMQQKREGNCNGLYGRLGDLGAIDQKYDVAISTACGPLDNIVVDSVATAQWCIEFLKKHGIGRATFIALDKQEHLRHLATSKINTPENVHRLYDLIKVKDEAVRTAFYYGLRDTLVANNLDQASRIAYGARRFRVVTLNGDLIETSGTMSGGGKTVSRGRMGQSVISDVNPKELESMERSLNKLEEDLRSVRQRQTALETQVNHLQPELREMKINFEKKSSELQSLKQQQPMLAQQLKVQEGVIKTVTADPAKVKQLTTLVEGKKVKYEKAFETAQELQVRVDELTESIKEKTTGKMKNLDKQIDEVKKSIDKCKAEVTRLKVAIKTSDRNAKVSSEKITTLEKNIDSAETRLREMQKEREVIEADAKKLLTCIEEITQQLANREEEYAGFKQQVASLTKEENKLQAEKVDVDQMLKSVNHKLTDCKTTTHQWHAKLAKLKLQEIPNEKTPELETFTPESLETKQVEAIQLELHAAENAIKDAKPNLNAIQEFRSGQKVFMQRSEELDAISNKRSEMKSVQDKVTNRRKDEFLAGYNIIKLKLKEMYQMITLGGDADFEIVDSFDPFAEGIQFNVRPPKKSWKKISNLSGGEKTLSSLALVFALHYYKPSPLYVMDEIDAALDFKNVSIVGHYIKERTKNAQFIIISLRSNMFELCDNLVGIYKTYNCTKTITIDPTVYGDTNIGDNNKNVPEINNIATNENDVIIEDSFEESLEEIDI